MGVKKYDYQKLKVSYLIPYYKIKYNRINRNFVIVSIINIILRWNLTIVFYKILYNENNLTAGTKINTKIK